MPRLKRALLFVHRWLGVALCLLFLTWFPSGIAMMYWGYPEVTDRDRLEHGIDLEPSQIRISPTDVYAASGMNEPPASIRINSHDGRPVYRFTDGEGETVVFADSGDFLEDVTPQAMLSTAAAWSRQPAADAIVTQMAEVDQWTLQIRLAEVGPVWKYEWPDGQHVYVSGATGEVVQHTTRGSRIGGYMGPVLHWFYFTPLRKHGREWSQVVIWTSAIGTVTAVLGLAIGLWMYLPRLRLVYTGQKRWHLLLGLIFGVATITWAFSGMLSMDPFPSFSGVEARRDAAAAVPRALRQQPSMAAFFAKPPQQALAELAGLHVRELAFVSLGGDAAYLATLAGGDTRVVPVNGPVAPEFNRQRLADLVTAAAAPAGVTMSTIEQYDAYYIGRDLPLPVLLAEVHDPQQTRFYVDPRTARIVGSYSSSRWVSRWLYRGLHSLLFPGLYTSRPLWDIVVIAFMVGGTALSVTSILLAWRALGSSVARLLRS